MENHAIKCFSKPTTYDIDIMFVSKTLLKKPHNRGDVLRYLQTR